MSRPKREPTEAELAIIRSMGSEWHRTQTEIRERLEQEIGDPPSAGLLNRWIQEDRRQQALFTAARVRGEA